MRSGRISAGNARQLAEAVLANRTGEQDRLIKAGLAAAASAGCSSLLFSSEWLLAALAAGQNLADFSQRVRRLGAERIELLLILRHPVEQFISMYRHRAKRGTAGTISEWASQGYPLPDRLAGLRRQLDAAGVRLTVREYRKQPGWLAHVFFADWLGVEAPPPAAGTVNPSLTLSELALIRHVAALRPDLVTDLYERLLAVDPGAKHDSDEMLSHARAVATRAVVDSAEEWRRWNEWLPESERLDIPAEASAAAPEPGAAVFSNRQSEAVVNLLADLARPRFLLGLAWRQGLRPALSRLRHGRWLRT